MRRTVVIGNAEQYPTQDLALAAVNGLRVSINEACNRQRQRSVLIGDLVDHLHKQLLLIRAPHHLQLGGRQLRDTIYYLTASLCPCRYHCLLSLLFPQASELDRLPTMTPYVPVLTPL